MMRLLVHQKLRCSAHLIIAHNMLVLNPEKIRALQFLAQLQDQWQELFSQPDGLGEIEFLYDGQEE